MLEPLVGYIRNHHTRWPWRFFYRLGWKYICLTAYSKKLTSHNPWYIASHSILWVHMPVWNNCGYFLLLLYYGLIFIIEVTKALTERDKTKTKSNFIVICVNIKQCINSNFGHNYIYYFYDLGNGIPYATRENISFSSRFPIRHYLVIVGEWMDEWINDESMMNHWEMNEWIVVVNEWSAISPRRSVRRICRFSLELGDSYAYR